MVFPFPGIPVRMPDDIRAEIDSIRHGAQIEEISRSRHIARDMDLDGGPVPSPCPAPT